MSDTNQSDVAEIRRQKLEELCSLGENPFLSTNFDFDVYTKEILDNFDKKNGTIVKIAGRIMSKRIMGGASFSNLQDSKGNIQIYVKRDNIGEKKYDFFKKIDIGDILGLTGEVFKTQKGEISVNVKEFELLSKSLLPLPEKFHGLKDSDLRYRKRYLDLIMNNEVKNTFKKRSKILQSIREYLNSLEYLEVETPILNVIPGGANAKPFTTHHNALNIDLYLRIAPELYLKRLVVGGFEKIYEIGRQFRNEGMDTKHNPEFTTIEIYHAYKNYEYMMILGEELIKAAGNDIINKNFQYNDQKIDLLSPFKKISMLDSIKNFTDADFEGLDLESSKQLANDIGVNADSYSSSGEIINLIFEEKVEANLIQPTYITEYPVEVSPLAKRMPNKPNFTERFELFICGREIANGFSELNDPLDQKERFLDQMRKREAGDEEANMMDEDFIEALSYGLPPTGGIGIGIDRLVMLLTNTHSIRDVLLFPTMKPILNNQFE